MAMAERGAGEQQHLEDGDRGEEGQGLERERAGGGEKCCAIRDIYMGAQNPRGRATQAPGGAQTTQGKVPIMRREGLPTAQEVPIRRQEGCTQHKRRGR
jgi:hypothetical protein